MRALKGLAPLVAAVAVGCGTLENSVPEIPQKPHHRLSGPYFISPEDALCTLKNFNAASKVEPREISGVEVPYHRIGLLVKLPVPINHFTVQYVDYPVCATVFDEGFNESFGEWDVYPNGDLGCFNVDEGDRVEFLEDTRSCFKDVPYSTRLDFLSVPGKAKIKYRPPM